MPTPAPRPEQRSPRSTRLRVHVADRVADVMISAGGLIVVTAVLGIMVYLLSVTVRLFEPGRADPPRTITAPAPASQQWFIDADEHLLAAVMLDRTGTVRLVDLASGRVADERVVTPEGRRLTAVARAPRVGRTALGYDDGTAHLGTIGAATRFLLSKEDAAALADLKPGETRVYGGGVVQRTPPGQLRLTELQVDMPAPAEVGEGAGEVTLLDAQGQADAEYLLAVRADGSAVLNRVTTITPLGGGPARVRFASFPIPLGAPPGRNGPPAWAFVTADGANALFLWPDGMCRRVNVRDPEKPAVIEDAALLPPGRRLTSASFLVGAKTLVLGDDTGATHGCFVARDPASANSDRSRIVRAHAHEGALTAAVSALGVSRRDRTFVAGDTAGGLALRNMTSDKVVLRLRTDGAIEHAAVAPKGDGVLAATGSTLTLWRLDPGHPEASWRSLFGKVWYEGEEGPSHVYQSSSGDDAAEPKLGLTPLLWGTIKATLYTMLLSAPLAILAAVYTSEFLSPRLRAAVKPTIETMASLPSVVLGFLAAIVLAPALASALPGVLLAFVLVPLGALIAAHLWLFVPVRVSSATPAGARMGMIALVLAASAGASLLAGPVIERALFTLSDREKVALVGRVEPVPPEQAPPWVGARRTLSPEQERSLRREGLAFRDGAVVRPVGSASDPGVREALEARGLDSPSIRAWLNGVYGSAFPGWFVIAFPLAVILVTALIARAFEAHSLGVGTGEATRELILLAAKLALGAALAWAAAWVLTRAGLDPRDSIFGPFDQRNTMVVALGMSVAVIPIIYTISEDAMSSVPESLRSASLAAGASRWQTAVRIILPVAGSGIFSGCMIGLGRAAGETMIVLMATGNTPVMSWSLFDGMRTLSANIAVEMPEAAKDSTHYRVLFLCGLALFVMTFVINSLAELVRQRFRRRSGVL